MKGFLQIGQVADILGVTTQTLRNWHNSGKFRACVNPNSGHRYYKIEKVREFLATLTASDETWISQNVQEKEEKKNVPYVRDAYASPQKLVDCTPMFNLRL